MTIPNRHRRRATERGAILILVVGALIPLLGCIALALDGFRWMSAKLQQDNIAEYAALAALEEYVTQGDFMTFEIRRDAALARVNQSAKLNYTISHTRDRGKNEAGNALGGVSISTNLNANNYVDFGSWNGSRFTSGGATINSVKVRLSMTDSNKIRALFAGVLGFRSLGATSVVCAYWDEDVASRTPSRNPYRIVTCG